VALAREPWDASHPHSHTLDNIRVEYEASVGLRCTVPWVSPAGTSQSGSGVCEVRLVVV